MPLNEKEILQHIVSHSIERAGAGAGAERIDSNRIREYLNGDRVQDYNRSARHDQFVRGAIITGVNLGNFSSNCKRCDAAQKFISEREFKHGRDPLVFIASGIFWSCHDDAGLSYREFSTACAVNSIIGFKKTPVLIRRAMIIARQLGYKTPQVMAAELTTDPAKRQPLSVQRLRDTLDNLERRDLFRRCQAGRRTVYFSTTLDAEQLRQAVKELKERNIKVRLRRELDRATFGKNHSGTTQEPLKNKEPVENQLETATGTTGGTTKRNALNKCPLTNALKQERDTGRAPSGSVLVEDLVESVARGTTESIYTEGGEPSLDDVRVFMENLFRGAGEFAHEWLKRMQDQAWKDQRSRPVRDWKKLAASWASGCEKRKRGVVRQR